MKLHIRGLFGLLVGDETHGCNGRGFAQGIAAGVLSDGCGRSLSLTGTLSGGYASTLFHLLYRFSPEIRTEFGHADESRWISRYGFVERTVGRADTDSLEDGRNSRRRKYRTRVRERPGLAPPALFHLIGNSVFLRLSDVASDLPDYDEQVMLSSMDTSTEGNPGHLSQQAGYDLVFGKLRKALIDALSKGSKKLLSTYLQTLLAYPDGCTRGETVFDPESGDILVQVPPLSEEGVYPKERSLIDLVAAERLAGRRVLVYVTHAGTRDITGRLDDMLTRHGFRVAVLNADTVAPDRREKWVADRVEEGDRRARLPSQAGADGPGPYRVPDAGVVRDRLLGLHNAAGVSALLEDRSGPSGQGGVHGVPRHPPGGRAQAGREEASVFAGGRGRRIPSRSRSWWMSRGRRSRLNPKTSSLTELLRATPWIWLRRGHQSHWRRSRQCSPGPSSWRKMHDPLKAEGGSSRWRPSHCSSGRARWKMS